MNSYSIDFSANQIVNTISNASITNAKGEQAEPKMNNWCRLKDIYCSMATINGYCQVATCKHIVNTITGATTTNAKCDQTDGKDHPDYGIPVNYIPQNEGIVITSDAVFIKPLKLVVLTEDVYNKLKEKENEMR